jgi:hypothetical protein
VASDPVWIVRLYTVYAVYTKPMETGLYLQKLIVMQCQEITVFHWPGPLVYRVYKGPAMKPILSQLNSIKKNSLPIYLRWI